LWFSIVVLQFGQLKIFALRAAASFQSFGFAMFNQRNAHAACEQDIRLRNQLADSRYCGKFHSALRDNPQRTGLSRREIPAIRTFLVGIELAN
jgi:hypothetical protein